MMLVNKPYSKVTIELKENYEFRRNKRYFIKKAKQKLIWLLKMKIKKLLFSSKLIENLI